MMLWALDAPIDRPIAKLALIAIADHADENGYCWPSQGLLLERVRCSERALRDALKWLEGEGFMARKERRRGDGTRTSDGYLLAFQGDGKQGKKQPANSADSTAINRQIFPYQPADFAGHEPPIEPPIDYHAEERARETASDCRMTRQDAVRIEGLLREAAGVENDPSPGLFVIGPIWQAMQDGADIEADILPVIRSRCAKGFKPRSWKYFLQAIADAKATRLSQPEGRANDPPSRRDGRIDPLDELARMRANGQTITGFATSSPSGIADGRGRRFADDGIVAAPGDWQPG
jgi:hypothetical protein